MKFNKLYLHGFKSFVDKTTVDFPDGITAIVGPNGSGKSNIMDAVRWVFGEQNAKELRGADMEDIVFNGSQKRKSAGFAEVGLTLSDIDEAVAAKYGAFSEITITRKFYKTGEREYYINNRKCRLKDIKDIFMDTGLGARSISIIEQGKVDKIINAGPEELRFFLEETAGVTRFKDKKKEAERRLQQTKDNLDRVTDIVEEIVTQMNALSHQAEQLKIYESMQSDFKRLERSYICTSHYIKAMDESRLKSRLIEKKQGYETLLAKYSEIVKRESIAENDAKIREDEYKTFQEKRIAAVTQKAQTEGDIAALEAKIASSGSVKANLHESIKSEEARLTEISETRERLSEELETAKDALEFVTDKADELNDIMEDITAQKNDTAEEFKDIDKKFLEYTELITAKRNETIRIESSFDHTKAALERLNREKEALETTRHETENNKISAEAEIEEINLKLSLDQDLYDKIKEEADEIMRALDECRMKHSEEKAEIKSRESHIAFLEKQIADFSLFNSDDADFLKEHGAKLLIDALHDEDKEKLIDIGDVFIFGDSERDAAFKKISDMKSSLRFAFESDLQVIREALNVSGIHSDYKNIYFHGGIYKKVGDEDKGFKIVALKESLNNELRLLEEVNEKLLGSEQLAEYLEGKSEAKSIELQDARNIYDETKNSLIKKETELSGFAAEFERLEKRKTTVEKEIEITLSAFGSAKEAAASLKEEIDTALAEQAVIEEQRTELEENLEIITDNLEEKRAELTELKIQKAQKAEIVHSKGRELERVKNMEREVRANADTLSARLEKLLNVDEIKWQDDLDRLKNSLSDMQKEALTAEEEARNASNYLEELRKDMAELKSQAESVNNSIKSSDNEIRKIELELAGIKSVLETNAAAYIEKYGTEIAHEYMTYADTQTEPNKIKEEMNKIEINIEELGPVNLNALNDYKEAEERYRFLTGQRADLEGSIADINSFIYETNEATARLFSETFDAVKEKFIEVFHILFGNGEADLKLTDPDNILTSGVEIYIQPPGKKLQHMGLLSGGEKALTAMTLLFALFLQKPTPFCFLDEVDAPLDDANVERYVGMVKALSDKTQFILITHNHNTMSVADSLYGVTMQEYGVSTILSVSLEQAARAGR